MNRETLEQVREGNTEAITEATAAIANMPRGELKQLWTAVIDGIVSQEETSEGIGKKLMLMSLSFAISPLYTRRDELVGYAKELNGGSIGSKMEIIEAITDKAYDEASQTACVYEDLTALAMVCSEKALAEAPGKMRTSLIRSASESFKHAISVGAAIANGFLDGEERQIAKKCLLNTVQNVVVHDREMIEEACRMKPNESADKVERRMERMCRDLGFGRQYAIETLSLFVEDYSLKALLVTLESNGPEQVTKAASYSLRAIREKDELETARADLGTLSEIEYPDVTSPQRWYLEIVFDAVETVLTKTNDESRRQEVLVALKQLAAYGAAPGPMKELIDDHSLGMVRKNVENALVHALVHGDDKMAEDAKEGLMKSSSDRVITILNKVADRERGEDGQLTDKGSMIRAIVAEIQRKRFGYSLPPPLPKRASIPPKQKMLH